MSTQHHVIVVGGGVAGLAAAVRLAAGDIPVLLLEQRARAGGRTFSFRDAASGDVLDNGQHLLLAGYHRTLALLSTIGSRHLLELQRRPELVFHHPGRGFTRLRLSALPSPLHLLMGILGFDALSPGGRIRLLAAGRLLHSPAEHWVGKTVGDFLDGARQGAEERRCFWDPLTIAIMNEVPARAAAAPFLRALRRAFLESPGDAALAFPVVGLSDLLVEPALAFLRARSCTVSCGTEVVQILVERGRTAGVLLRDGSIVRAEAVIMAVPWYLAVGLLPGAARIHPLWQQASATPIISIHLWFPDEAMQDPMVGLIGRRVQWLFNRRAITHTTGPGGHCSAVISAAADLAGLSNEQLIRIAADDLSGVYPAFARTPVRGVVIREKRATPSLTPELDAVRPGTATPLPGLFLAGDWTDTGFPATIEGGVLSGEAAAGLARVHVERRS